MSASISPGQYAWKSKMTFPDLSTLQTGAAQGSQEKNFGTYLWDGVNEVNNMQHDADAAIHELLTGGDVNQAEVMTTVQKSEMAFRLLTQIRNKLLTAYEELNAIRF
jgi:flagellar hook-basal body complex protein FliE